MKLRTTLLSASALTMLLSVPAFAQGALVGVEGLDEQIEDIQSDVAEDIAEGEDAFRFGGNQYAQGWTGSIALGMNGTSGNTDTKDFSVAGRLRYGNGPWNHTFGFAGELSEDTGTRTEEQFYATYDVNRYFSDNAYVFGLGSVNYDGFATNEWDAFVGAGPGFRIINQPNVTWRVQAGPGARYMRDQMGADSTELAGIASSRFYFLLTDGIFLTNDTDVLYSDTNVLATNDIGMTFKMSDRLSTRASYRTEWNSDPLPGFDEFDNTIGLSLVYGF